MAYRRKRRNPSAAFRRALRKLRKATRHYLAKRKTFSTRPHKVGKRTCYSFLEPRYPAGYPARKGGRWSAFPGHRQYKVTHCYASKKALLARFRKGRKK